VKLVSSTQKNDAVEAVKAYLLGAKFQARTASMIANAVDELILNAVFDAPVDELGKQIYARTARSTAIKLEGPNEVLLKIAFDGQYVAISVIDQFGSLEKSKFLSHVSKVYVDEQYQLRSTVANAGIGLATVFKSGGSFFFVSENRTRTECTVFFKRTVNFKESKEQFRFLSTQFYF